MGILGYPNMDDNNQDGVFGDYSDVYSNFSEDGSAPQEFKSGAEYAEESFDEQAQAAANVQLDRQVSQEEQVVEPQVQEDNRTLQERRAAQAGNSSSNGFVLVLLLLALVSAGVYYYKNNMMQNNTASEVQSVGDYFYDAAGGNQVANAPQEQGNMATVEVDIQPVASQNETKEVAKAQQKEVETSVQNAQPEQKPEVKNPAQKAADKKKDDESKSFRASEVVVTVNSGGRLDPFMPLGEKTVSATAPKFDIVSPPLEVPQEIDPMINKMSGFKISGIMFDDVRPSAILTIDGAEQLVHIGDLVAGYQIKDITRTKVVVKYNTNTYEVSAGESVGNIGVNVNPVSTLNKQFGGAYTETPENAIKFY